MNCGTLRIRSNNLSDFSKFDFGISQTNGTTPNLWGGVVGNLPNGKKAQVFTNLAEGFYTWFVRLKGTTNIVKTGISQVNCDEPQTADCCESFTKDVVAIMSIRIEAIEHKMKKVHGVACYDTDNNYTFVTPTIPKDSSFVEVAFLGSFSGRIEFF